MMNDSNQETKIKNTKKTNDRLFTKNFMVYEQYTLKFGKKVVRRRPELCLIFETTKERNENLVVR